MVAKLSYINSLEKKDVEDIESIMDELTGLKDSSNVDKLSIKLSKDTMKTNSKGGEISFCRIEANDCDKKMF